MRTALEIAIQLDELLKRSKPFRNFNEVFGLTEELIITLSPSESAVESVVEESVVEVTEEDIKLFNESVASFLEIESIEEPITEQPIVEVTEEPTTSKKSSKKK